MADAHFKRGGGRLGYKHTDEAKRKISEAAKRPRPKTPMAERLARRSRRDEATGCLLWTGHVLSQTGYGVVKVSSSPVRYRTVHRVAYELAYGAPPDDRPHVCHRCDVRRCIEPTHLFAGSPHDNMQDCWDKGRGYLVGGATGEDHPNASITWEIAREIRARRGRGESVTAIASDLGVSFSVAYSVASGRTWRER